MARAVTGFCGKGGVGKTTLSLAYAILHAEQGRKVLVVTSHPIPELALTISLKGLKDIRPEAAANLFVIHIESREVLQNTVRQSIGSGILADAVLSSRIYKSLIEVVPGLKEIAFVSRMRQLATQGVSPEAPQGFDLIVWDTPATGHFLRTLEVAKNFDSYLSGPLALLGKDLAGFLTDPGGLILIPVAIPEEMAVDETIELCRKLGDLKIQPAAVVCNLASPLLAAPEEGQEALRRNFAANVAGTGNLNFILERHAIERAMFGRLRLAGAMPKHIVERSASWNSDVELLLDLARQLTALSTDTPTDWRS